MLAIATQLLQPSENIHYMTPPKEEEESAHYWPDVFLEEL